MLILTKQGLNITNIRDILDVGLKINYQLFDCPARSMVARVAGISKAEATRKIKQGGVWFGDDKLKDPFENIEIGNVATTVFIGKELSGIILPIKSIYKE